MTIMRIVKEINQLKTMIQNSNIESEMSAVLLSRLGFVLYGLDNNEQQRPRLQLITGGKTINYK